MSFKTALASCWDICKRNCTNDGKDFSFKDFPKFSFDVYETYSDASPYRPYPYDEKPSHSSCSRGITEVEDKLVSSFLGWIFTIPEMLVWATVAVLATLSSALALLLLVVTVLLAPIFLSMRDLEIYLNYTQFLGDTWKILRDSVAFTFLAFLRVPYHLIKALVRIPAGVVVAVQEIVSPSRVPVSEQVVDNGSDSQAISGGFNPSRLNPMTQPNAGRRSGISSRFDSDDEDSSEERQRYSDDDGDIEGFSREDDEHFARDRAYMDDQFSFIYEVLMIAAVQEIFVQILAQNPHIDHDVALIRATAQVMERFPLGSRLLTSRTQGNPRNNDLQTAIDISVNENHPPSAPIQEQETKENWCEKQLDKLKFKDRPERYTCVISGALMNPPFLVGDGYLYNENSIETYFKTAGRKSPMTRAMLSTSKKSKTGIVLEAVKNEIVSFTIAVRANYYLDKIQGREEKNSGTKTVLAITAEIEKKAGTLHDEINEYVKERHEINLQRINLRQSLFLEVAKKMVNNETLSMSTHVIAKAWSYIQTLTGSSEDAEVFTNMSPTDAMAHFFTLIKNMDASFDNLIINVLREAMLEEQDVSKEYATTWVSRPRDAMTALAGELSAKLNQYLPSEKPQNLDGVVEKIQKDKSISDTALEYTLVLINNPESTVNFDQFKPEKKERSATVRAFLKAFYAPENTPLKPVFLMTIKETVLKEEEMVLKQSAHHSSFGSVLQKDANANRQDDEDCDLPAAVGVSLVHGM